MSFRTALIVFSLWAAAASAQTPTAANPPADPAVPAPPAPPAPADLPTPPPAQTPTVPFAPPTGDITLEDWNRDDWLLVKPATSLLEVHGYFRLRGDMMRKLDFDNGAPIEQLTIPGSYVNDAGQTVTVDAGPRYGGPLNRASPEYNATNMRLRLEPQINVTDRVHIITTFDVFDNLVMGSNPQSLGRTGYGTPTDLTSTSQTKLADAIVVRRAYARLTALNEQLELKFGRMPNHWGLGMMANSGDCLDCEYGDTVDRLSLTFKAVGHVFTPMYDWVATGPRASMASTSMGQPIDAYDKDDAGQYSVQISKSDHPEDIREIVRQGDTVLNYGVWAMARTQDRSVNAETYNGDNVTPVVTEARDGFLGTLNGHGALYSGPFTLKAEAAFVWGSFKDTNVAADAAGTSIGNLAREKTTVFQLGGALEGSWQMPEQRPGSIVSLMAGGASGDSAYGFGALDRAETQRGKYKGVTDHSLNNFQFNPDYHVDLLMFRRILGTVTDAWYVKPGITYMFDNKFAGSIAAIYSQAMFKRSTPGNSRPMGLEFDAELSYGTKGTADSSPFGGSLAGGLAFPFGAFTDKTGDTDESGSFAWTMQARLFVAF